LLVTGCWWLVAGGWWLVAGGWLRVAGYVDDLMIQNRYDTQPETLNLKP
jgi:hypothetical protein